MTTHPKTLSKPLVLIGNSCKFRMPSNTLFNGALFSFDNYAGKHLAEMFMKYLVIGFNPIQSVGFDSIGPRLITQVLRNLCQTGSLDEIIKKGNCQGFHPLDNKFCYEIPYEEWPKLMNQTFADEVMRRVDKSLAVHFWNFASKRVAANVRENSAYIQLARQFCPKVLKTFQDFL